MTSNGDVTVSYDFEYGGPETAAREDGFRFEVPLRSGRLSSVRKSELSWYPEGRSVRSPETCSRTQAGRRL